MPYNNLRRALGYGPTVAVRFFVSLASLLQAARFLINRADWLAGPDGALITIFSLRAWGYAYLIAGALGLWRTLAPSPAPIWGWSINTLLCLVWTAGLIARTKYDPTTLFATYTAVWMMAVWCLLRTEATSLDTRAT